jgi:RHS repeat-associated protein
VVSYQKKDVDYYPFGLTMAGISSKAAGSLDNKKEYNGNELQNREFSDGSGLEMYDFNARTYDQQIGRFFQIDPMTEEGGQESISPYHFSYNNPIRYNDPSGKAGEDCCKVLSDAASWVGNKIEQVGNSSPVAWINNNVNPLTPLAELVTGKSLNSGFTEDKSRVESGVQLATFAVPSAKAEGIIVNEAKNLAVGQIERRFVSLDNNALSAAVKEGKKDLVKASIGADKPIVSITAAKEFLAFGNKAELKGFMTEVGATISKNGGSASQAAALQKTASGMGRSLGNKDAMILAGAKNNGAAIITADRKFANFMNAIGFPNRNF